MPVFLQKQQRICKPTTLQRPHESDLKLGFDSVRDLVAPVPSLSCVTDERITEHQTGTILSLGFPNSERVNLDSVTGSEVTYEKVAALFALFKKANPDGVNLLEFLRFLGISDPKGHERAALEAETGIVNSQFVGFDKAVSIATKDTDNKTCRPSVCVNVMETKNVDFGSQTVTRWRLLRVQEMETLESSNASVKVDLPENKVHSTLKLQDNKVFFNSQSCLDETDLITNVVACESHSQVQTANDLFTNDVATMVVENMIDGVLKTNGVSMEDVVCGKQGTRLSIIRTDDVLHFSEDIKAVDTMAATVIDEYNIGYGKHGMVKNTLGSDFVDEEPPDLIGNGCEGAAGLHSATHMAAISRNDSVGCIHNVPKIGQSSNGLQMEMVIGFAADSDTIFVVAINSCKHVSVMNNGAKVRIKKPPDPDPDSGQEMVSPNAEAVHATTRDTIDWFYGYKNGGVFDPDSGQVFNAGLVFIVKTVIVLMVHDGTGHVVNGNSPMPGLVPTSKVVGVGLENGITEFQTRVNLKEQGFDDGYLYGLTSEDHPASMIKRAGVFIFSVQASLSTRYTKRGLVFIANVAYGFHFERCYAEWLLVKIIVQIVHDRVSNGLMMLFMTTGFGDDAAYARVMAMQFRRLVYHGWYDLMTILAVSKMLIMNGFAAVCDGKAGRDTDLAHGCKTCFGSHTVSSVPTEWPLVQNEIQMVPTAYLNGVPAISQRYKSIAFLSFKNETNSDGFINIEVDDRIITFNYGNHIDDLIGGLMFMSSKDITHGLFCFGVNTVGVDYTNGNVFAIGMVKEHTAHGLQLKSDNQDGDGDGFWNKCCTWGVFKRRERNKRIVNNIVGNVTGITCVFYKQLVEVCSGTTSCDSQLRWFLEFKMVNLGTDMQSGSFTHGLAHGNIQVDGLGILNQDAEENGLLTREYKGDLQDGPNGNMKMVMGRWPTYVLLNCPASDR